MKKVLTIFCLIVLMVFNLSLLSACNNNSQESSNIVYSEEYSFNNNHHWREEIGGTNRTDIGSHENLGGKCKYCDFYYDSTKWLVFEKINVYGYSGYGVSEYLGDRVGAYTHIEIPAFYKGDNDSEPIPVIAIAGDVFSNVEHDGYNVLESVKLNEGLKFIGNGAFEGTNIIDIKIPNSVIGGSLTYDWSRWPEHGGLYNVFAGCSLLSSVDTGDSLQVIGAYTFAYCNALKTVRYGSSLREIRQRAFYEAYGYENVVLPNTVVSIPEGSYFDRGDHFTPDNNNDLERWLSEVNVFPYAKNVFLDVYKDELVKLRLLRRDMLTGIPLDENGNELDPNTYATDFGFVEGWCGMAKIYYKGEWYFDSDGNPMPY
ncbi:MAG: leucine-rich repeat domain-containing protein [Clostridiales bacterium]|nr:leucine-rich repeat domain-containing protein [Clostridiales bacterium]